MIKEMLEDEDKRDEFVSQEAELRVGKNNEQIQIPPGS